MIKFVLSAVLFSFPVVSSAADLEPVLNRLAAPPSGPASELEDYIIVPFQGTWVQGANTFIFTAGDTRESAWIIGNIIGGGGQTNRYLWQAQTVLTGTFYFDTAQGRQGPISVTFSNNNRTMTWRFGAETTVLTKVN